VLGGKNIFTEKLSENGILVIGNEGSGIRPDYLPLITKPIMIPGASDGAESLNAAVAAGIICALFRNSNN
jgi:TrmH family RNA methyltransferase